MKRLSEMDWGRALIGHHFREKPGFFSEFIIRLAHKVLPPHVSKNDAVRFINALPKNAFPDVLEKAYETEPELVQTISGAATEAFNQLATIVNGAVLQDPLFTRIQQLENTPPTIEPVKGMHATHLPPEIEELQNLTNEIRKSFGDLGTSIDLSYRNEKLYSDLVLLKHLFVLQSSDHATQQHQSVCDLSSTLKRENSLADYLDRKLDLVVEQIVQLNADTGEQYIAQSKAEYGSYFRSALLGGVLVAGFAIAKVFLSQLDLPPLTLGVLFGINYAACFSICALIGGTIATKQPSMTATALSRHLVTQGSSRTLIKRLLASQTLTLLGNVLAAITVTAAFDVLFPFSVETKASLVEKNTLSISVIWYATVAGIFLSLAGLVSGYVANLLEYRQIGPRIYNRFGWKPSKQAGKITPKIVGSIVLGMSLGLTGTFGKITGLPLDIRHIAFSSAHASIGWTLNNLLWLIAGLGAIATVNLFVSFGTTFFVSRSYRSRRTREQ